MQFWIWVELYGDTDETAKSCELLRVIIAGSNHNYNNSLAKLTDLRRETEFKPKRFDKLHCYSGGASKRVSLYNTIWQQVEIKIRKIRLCNLKCNYRWTLF